MTPLYDISTLPLPCNALTLATSMATPPCDIFPLPLPCNTLTLSILPLLIGWLLDLLLGDPQWLPHPIVWFGNTIALGERHLNKGKHRRLKGTLLAAILVTSIFAATSALKHLLTSPKLLPVAGGWPWLLISSLLIFYSLAGTTLIREVRQTFIALDRSLNEGRKQVARIVGRDTSELSAQEIRTAALETLAENLSDGVIAPLFWFAIGGVPAMLTYKMINTLDSMIGYQTHRYKDFGCFAARLDDAANYIPARLTAFLMLLASGRPSLLPFVWKNGPRHASPNSGYPEAALAGILNCRFGGPHTYFGQLFEKPFIGENNRPLTTHDMHTAIRINRTVEAIAILLIMLLLFAIHYYALSSSPHPLVTFTQ